MSTLSSLLVRREKVQYRNSFNTAKKQINGCAKFWTLEWTRGVKLCYRVEIAEVLLAAPASQAYAERTFYVCYIITRRHR